MRIGTVLAAVAVISAGATSPASCAVLRATTLGCRQAADAMKLVVSPNAAEIEKLKASRACIPFAKGIAIDVDEDKPPLSCIRLKGDLECWWVSDHTVDEFPGEAPGKAAHGGRHKS